MAMPIKTRILLPRDTFENWEKSERVLLAGELVLVYDKAGKFKLFEGRGAAFGTGASGVNEIQIDPSQIVISGDVPMSIQSAIDNIRAQAVSALTAVSECQTGVVTAISADGHEIYVQYADLSGSRQASAGNAIAGVEYDHSGQITAVTEISVINSSDFGINYDSDVKKIYLSVAGNVIETDMSSVVDCRSIGQITPDLLSADAEWIFDCNM